MQHGRRKDVVARLFATLHETLPFFDQPADALNRSYAPGMWTLREILVHLSDTEAAHLDRLRRTAAEKKPDFLSYDENEWAAKLLYKQRDLNLARLQFDISRRQVIELAWLLDESVDARVGMHSEAGPQTFAFNLNKLATHNAHHLEQIRAIAEGRTWQKT